MTSTADCTEASIKGQLNGVAPFHQWYNGFPTQDDHSQSNLTEKEQLTLL